MYITLYITYIFKDGYIFYTDWLQRSSGQGIVSLAFRPTEVEPLHSGKNLGSQFTSMS